MKPTTEKALRLRLAQWMRTILQERGWSAEEWAKRAQTSSTNITRMLSNPETASIPKVDTLAKLAQAAGSAPSLFTTEGAAPASYRVPLLTREQIRSIMGLDRNEQAEALAEAVQKNAITTLYKPSPRAFAVQIESDSLNARGIFKGDTVIAEPVDFLPPTNGSLVVAIDDDGLAVYLYQPPFLLPHSHQARYAPMPIDEATILGRAVRIERPLI